MTRTILIMAAGTGGHVFPGLAIAKELAARGWKVAWMGTPTGMEGRPVAQAGYATEQVDMTRGRVQKWHITARDLPTLPQKQAQDQMVNHVKTAKG